MANPELGTKRICPETGRKFYDLNKDPIVSPYTGKTYPLSFFQTIAAPIRSTVEDEEEVADKEVENDDEIETISLEEVEEEGKDAENLPDLGDDEDDDVDLGDDDDDTFLADDDEEDDGLDDIVGVSDDDDDDN